MIYSTEAFGDIAQWPTHAKNLTEIIWQQAQAKWDEDLFVADMAYTNGIDLLGGEVILATAAPSGVSFINAMLFLLKRGVVEVMEEFEWEKIYLTREFIESQQAARKCVEDRTNRLSDMLSAAYGRYRLAVTGLGTANSYEREQKIQRRAGIALQQLHRLSVIGAAGRKAGTIDSELWIQRTESILADTLRRPAHV